MTRKSITALMVVAIVGGCATAPEKRDFSNARSYAMSKDSAWEALLGYFTSNNIQIKTIEKDSGVIYAERSSFDPTMADCGQKPLAVDLARLATLNVFVRPTGGQTQVTINTQFEVRRTFDNQSWTDPCFSTGVLEGEILRSIGAGA